MFEQLARIEQAVRDHAPAVLDELARAVDALDDIARAVRRVADAIEHGNDPQEVIEGTAERVN